MYRNSNEIKLVEFSHQLVRVHSSIISWIYYLNQLMKLACNFTEFGSLSRWGA